MFRGVQPVQTVFMSTIAFFIAWIWAGGIKRALKGKWSILGFAVILSAAAALIVFGDKNDPRFLPPQTTIGTWSVVGTIFVGTILVNLIALPLLSQQFGEQIVNAVSVVVVFFLFGGALYWLGRLGTDLDNRSRAGAIFAAYIMFGIGVIVALRGIWMYVHHEL